jgi:hypothetical protein
LYIEDYEMRLTASTSAAATGPRLPQLSPRLFGIQLF